MVVVAASPGLDQHLDATLQLDPLSVRLLLAVPISYLRLYCPGSQVGFFLTTQGKKRILGTKLTFSFHGIIPLFLGSTVCYTLKIFILVLYGILRCFKML